MVRSNNLFSAAIAVVGMMLLILDSKHALLGAVEGLELCYRTVIPSLFPFFVFSALLTNSLTGTSIPLLKPVCRLCGIPKGGESLLAIGLLGGYPVGAQCVYGAYSSGHLSSQEARRLLGFCSNAGPSFIFGIAASLFSSPIYVWVLWAIHIVSVLLVGSLLPGKSRRSLTGNSSERITLQQILQKSINAMCSVCAWIILFKILFAICEHWFLWRFPEPHHTFIIGILELTNGCFSLRNIESECLRFILCSGMLAFGGICVGMQTVSVTGALGTGTYFPGKILQCAFSILLAYIMSFILFPSAYLDSKPTIWLFSIILSFIIIAATLLFFKKTVAFCIPFMYNKKKET